MGWVSDHWIKLYNWSSCVWKVAESLVLRIILHSINRDILLVFDIVLCNELTIRLICGHLCVWDIGNLLHDHTTVFLAWIVTNFFVNIWSQTLRRFRSKIITFIWILNLILSWNINILNFIFICWWFNTLFLLILILHGHIKVICLHWVLIWAIFLLHEVFVFYMSLFMVFTVSIGCEAFLAYITFVRFFAGVSSHMVNPAGFIFETLTTVLNIAVVDLLTVWLHNILCFDRLGSNVFYIFFIYWIVR